MEQPTIYEEVMEQVAEFSKITKIPEIQVVNDALRHWFDNVARERLSELGFDPSQLSPRFETRPAMGHPPI